MNFFVFISKFGPWLAIIILIVFAFFEAIRDTWQKWKRDWFDLVTFVLSVALTVVVIYLLKHLVGEARPYTAGAVLHPLIMETGYDSFPSNHTGFLFAMATNMFFVNRKWAIPLGILALLVGWSRVVVGAHYWHDVIAGAIIGIVIPTLIWGIYAIGKKRSRAL